ncbi:MAG: hypothetical protein ACI9EF_002396 [Pseudohongiellaceae bacterium]|jgi:hypothetical protein
MSNTLIVLTRTIAFALLLTPLAQASDPGFVAHFSNLDEHSFGSSQSSVTNVPTGGVAGVGAGYLSVALNFSANLGAQTATPELVGDHVAAGASGVTFWLRDTGADDALQIHVGVGMSTGTVFLSNQGFSPPTDRWQRYHVSFDDESAWTRIKGNGSLLTALQTSNRLLFRHDVPPLSSMPNDTIGDFGIDRIAITPCDYEVYGVDGLGSNVLSLDTLSATPVGTTHTWTASGAPSAATGFLVLSALAADLPIFGGSLLVDPTVMLMLPVVANGAGDVVLPLAVPPDPALVDLTVYAQIALRDVGQPAGWALSNGLSATLCE